MDRKKIIVNEIKYWKKNRLLPEQYCNFLLTLYTEGEETGNEKAKKAKSIPSLFIPLLLTTFGLSLLGLTFLVIYFTDFSSLLQTALILSFSILLFFLSSIAKRFKYPFADFLILMGAVIFFLGTIHVVSTLFPNQPSAIMVAVAVTCMIWVIVGKKYNLKYFTISGAFGFIIVIYFLLFS